MESLKVDSAAKYSGSEKRRDFGLVLIRISNSSHTQTHYKLTNSLHTNYNANSNIFFPSFL